MLVLHSECPALKLLARGKVRDVYEVDEHTILFVATDRISAFDVVMKTVRQNPNSNRRLKARAKSSLKFLNFGLNF